MEAYILVGGIIVVIGTLFLLSLFYFGVKKGGNLKWYIPVMSVLSLLSILNTSFFLFSHWKELSKMILFLTKTLINFSEVL